MMKDKTKERSSEKTTNKYERRLIRKIKLFGSSKDADTLVRMYYDEIYYFVIDFRRRSIRWTVSLDNIYDADTFVPYDEASRSSGHAFVDLTDYGDLLSNKQLLADIECYVSRSRTDIQQIFRLHIYGGQTFKEIALALQIPESSVKSKYYRLIDQIRKEFNDEYHRYDDTNKI